MLIYMISYFSTDLIFVIQSTEMENLVFRQSSLLACVNVHAGVLVWIVVVIEFACLVSSSKCFESPVTISSFHTAMCHPSNPPNNHQIYTYGYVHKPHHLPLYSRFTTYLLATISHFSPTFFTVTLSLYPPQAFFLHFSFTYLSQFFSDFLL